MNGYIVLLTATAFSMIYFVSGIGHYKQDVNGFVFNNITHSVGVTGDIWSMEEDQYLQGNVIFSTSVGLYTINIADGDYQEWIIYYRRTIVNTYPLAFTQMNQTHVIIIDPGYVLNSSPVRQLDRVSNLTWLYRHSLFSRQYFDIIKDTAKEGRYFAVSANGEQSLITLVQESLTDSFQSLPHCSGQNTPSFPQLTFDPCSNWIYVTANGNKLFRIDIQLKSCIELAGIGPSQSHLAANSLSGILSPSLLDKYTLLVSDRSDGSLKVIDLKDNSMYNICLDPTETYHESTWRHCTLDRPGALLYRPDRSELLIAGYRRIYSLQINKSTSGVSPGKLKPEADASLETTQDEDDASNNTIIIISCVMGVALLVCFGVIVTLLLKLRSSNQPPIRVPQISRGISNDEYNYSTGENTVTRSNDNGSAVTDDVYNYIDDNYHNYRDPEGLHPEAAGQSADSTANQSADSTANQLADSTANQSADSTANQSSVSACSDLENHYVLDPVESELYDTKEVISTSEGCGMTQSPTDNTVNSSSGTNSMYHVLTEDEESDEIYQNEAAAIGDPDPEVYLRDNELYSGGGNE